MRQRKSCFISTQVDFNNKMCLIWYPLALALTVAGKSKSVIKRNLIAQHLFPKVRLGRSSGLPGCPLAFPTRCEVLQQQQQQQLQLQLATCVSASSVVRARRQCFIFTVILSWLQVTSLLTTTTTTISYKNWAVSPSLSCSLLTVIVGAHASVF